MEHDGRRPELSKSPVEITYPYSLTPKGSQSPRGAWTPISDSNDIFKALELERATRALGANAAAQTRVARIAHARNI